AALNSIEPAIQQLVEIDLFNSEQEWAKARRPEGGTRAKQRHADLATALGANDYLEGRFTVGDLMMTTVLRFPRRCDLVASQPRLKAYQERCEARPAFQRALRGQMEAFEASPAVN